MPGERANGSISMLIAAVGERARVRLTRQLEGIEGIEVIGEAATGVHAIVLTHRLRPDVVLVEAQSGSALDITPRLVRALKGAGAEVIVLGRFLRPHDVRTAWHHGLSGLVDIDVTPEELAWAVQMSASGVAFFLPAASRHSDPDALPTRSCEL
jgi:DNA-binding NarL/FixJ family response regulator